MVEQADKKYYMRPRSAGSLMEFDSRAGKIESKVKKKKRLPSLTTVVAGSSVALVGAATGFGQYYADDPFYIPVETTAFFLDFECMRPESDSLAEVNRVLNTPNDPELQALAKHFEKKGKDLYGTAKYRRIQEEKAEEYGVTLLSAGEESGRVENAESKDEVIDVLNSFSKDFGFKFEIFREGSVKSIRDIYRSFTGIPDEELSLTELKTATKEILNTLSNLPLEVGKLSNMHRVLLVKELEYVGQGSYENPAGFAFAFNRSIYLDLNALKLPDYIGEVFLHEISHGVDATECGDFASFSDNHYLNLNEDGFSYRKDFWNADVNPNVISQYSNKAPIEDKAEIMTDMLTGLVDINQMSPTVRNKYVLELTRLEDNIPGIAGYLRSVSLFGEDNLG